MIVKIEVVVSITKQPFEGPEPELGSLEYGDMQDSVRRAVRGAVEDCVKSHNPLETSTNLRLLGVHLI